MTIYIILVFLILILAFLCNDKNYKYGKLIYCTYIGATMLLIMGLRSISLGQNDVEYSYVPMFYNIKNMSLSELLKSGYNDIAFHILTKLFSYFIPNVHAWIFFISTIFIVSVTYLIYSESKIPSLSFILFLGLNYYGYNFTILRHSLSLSMVIISYLMIVKNKKILAIIMYILACMFHASALFFIIVLAIKNKKVGIKNILIIFISLCIINNFGIDILNYIFENLNMYRLIRYQNSISTFNYSMFFITFSIYAISFINRKKAIYEDNSVIYLFNLGTVSLVILTFINTFALAFRVSMFFGIFNILLLPNVLYYNENKIQKILIYLGTITAFSIYFLFFAINNSSINPYQFFW